MNSFSKQQSYYLIVAGILGVIGIALGAYAAHGLESFLRRQELADVDIAKRISQCEVAVRYQMIHTVAIFALGLWKRSQRGLDHIEGSEANNRRLSRFLELACWFWLLGIVLFSGGLYSIAFLGKLGHWAIVPSGGLSFILGWSCIVGLGLRRE